MGGKVIGRRGSFDKFLWANHMRGGGRGSAFERIEPREETGEKKKPQITGLGGGDKQSVARRRCGRWDHDRTFRWGESQKETDQGIQDDESNQ